MPDVFNTVVGGRVYLTWYGGTDSQNLQQRRVEATGTMRMRVTGQKRDAKVTASGKLVGTVEAAAYTTEVDLYKIEGNDPMEMWTAAVKVNITFIEQDTARTHYFTGAYVHGEPEYDPTQGTITGMRFATDQYSTN
jgi:hypothetical protein